MKWTETITPKQAVEELGVPYHGWMREMDRAWVSEDGQYSVMSRLLRTPVGKVEHVAITSAAGCGKCDGSGDIPWAVKMAINKKTREAVYRKYGGRCAYCGRAIAYKDMQVDHFRPLRVWDEVDGAADDISNLMPACRMCNHYKRANSLEAFRRYIAEIPRKLRDNYIYKIGVAYRNIIENEKPIKFFFETEEAKTNPEYAITSPEEMARYLMGFCRCRLATGNGCPGCPFDKPTSDNGDGECRLYVPDDWDF